MMDENRSAVVRSEIEENKIIACLSGRIDSANAARTKEALDEILSENPGRELVIDAGELTYLSSAGLRVLLQIKKQQDSGLTVRNVTPEVYEILDMTGFVNLLNVKKKLRELSVDGCEVIGRGAIGTVYRIDEDTVVKVYEIPDCLPMIENEQRLARLAFLKGIPTAISYDIVKVGDKYGTVFEMLKASTCNDVIAKQPERKDEIVRKYAHFLRQIHSVETERGELPQAKEVFLERLEQLRQILPDAMRGRLYALLEAMPEDLHLVHGDIQMKNILLSADEPLLIDMDTLCAGDPAFDLMGICVTYVLFPEDEPNNTQDFLGLPEETCAYIWKKSIEYYFEGSGQKAVEEAVKKIRILGCLRFLYLIAVLGIGAPALKQIRIDHALAHLEELLPQVDSLAVGR